MSLDPLLWRCLGWRLDGGRDLDLRLNRRLCRNLHGLLDQRIREVSRSLTAHSGMKRLDEAAGFLVGAAQDCLPLCGFESSGCEHGRRNRKPVGYENFEEPQRQRQGCDGSGSGGAEIFVHVGCIRGDRFQRLRDRRAGSARPGSSDEVDQLPPANRRIPPVARRLVENGQQTIVETHRDSMSLKTSVESV